MTSTVLYRWQPGWGLPSISPACIQVEAYLRFAQLDFAVEDCNFRKTSPTGQHPALASSSDIIAENEEFLSARACIHHLKVTAKDIDRQLSSSEMADLTAFSSLIQNNLEPATLYTTWCETESFSKHAQGMYGQDVPGPLAYVLTWLQRYAVQKKIRQTTSQQVYAGLASAYAAIAERLSAVEGDFFFGNKPSSLDALLFGHLAFLLAAPVSAPEIREQIKQYPILKRYVDQLSREYFRRPVPSSATKMSKEWRERAEAAAGRPRQQDSQEQHATAKEELEYYGKIWLGCAAAAVGAFALFSGQYVSIAIDEDDFDDDL